MDSSHSFLLPHTDFLARNQYELVGQKEVAVNLSVKGNVTVQIRIALFGFVVYFYVSMFFLAYPLIIPFSNSLSEKKLWPFAINLWSCIKDSKGCFHPFFKRLKNSAVLRLFNPLLRLDFRWKSPYRDWYLAWNIYGLFYIARQPFIVRVSNCLFVENAGSVPKRESSGLNSSVSNRTEQTEENSLEQKTRTQSITRFASP